MILYFYHFAIMNITMNVCVEVYVCACCLLLECVGLNLVSLYFWQFHSSHNHLKFRSDWYIFFIACTFENYFMFGINFKSLSFSLELFSHFQGGHGVIVTYLKACQPGTVPGPKSQSLNHRLDGAEFCCSLEWGWGGLLSCELWRGMWQNLLIFWKMLLKCRLKWYINK